MSHIPEDILPIVERLCSAQDQGPNCPKMDGLAKLSQRIWDHFQRNKETRLQLEKKLKLWKELEHLSSQMDCDLKVTGSTVTGFGRSGSDVDMCIFSKRKSSLNSQHLSRAQEVIRIECRNYQSGEIIRAKVPVLKMKFQDAEIGTINVDLTIDNHSAVRNTPLLFYYSQLDPRVRPLVMAVKWWAKKNDINEPRWQTLSSYTLTLMVIHYLQCGVSPPVLPCLQEKHSEIFNDRRNIFDLSYDDEAILSLSSENKQSVGSLYKDFFNYFTVKSRFDNEIDVVSVRTGGKNDKYSCKSFARIHNPGISLGTWNCRVLVEEPFNRTNVASAVCKDEKWSQILDVFKDAAMNPEKFES